MTNYRVVRIRKEKWCHACERILRVGDQALFWTSQQPDTNLLYSDHWCLQCKAWYEEPGGPLKSGEVVHGGDFLERRLEAERQAGTPVPELVLSPAPPPPKEIADAADA